MEITVTSLKFFAADLNKVGPPISINSIKFLMKCVSKKNKVIYLTSNSGYGVGKKNKFCDEKSPLNPISLYGNTKVEAEKVVMKFKNAICFRLATVFGYSYRMRTDLLVNNFVFNAIKKNELKDYDDKKIYRVQT